MRLNASTSHACAGTGLGGECGHVPFGAEERSEGAWTGHLWLAIRGTRDSHRTSESPFYTGNDLQTVSAPADSEGQMGDGYADKMCTLQSLNRGFLVADSQRKIRPTPLCFT